ncbi:MAG: S26 family signal peptidase [Planctomycetota bacterium]|nr:S26 family signal peptidase [Planctomycetota bacterium]
MPQSKNRPAETADTHPGSSGERRGYNAPKPDGFRDTIESIVIAFIFAFVFRAFVVEAFVIPTGSMAPTLYGMHGQHRCACCRYPFAYGIREHTIVNGTAQGGTLGNESFTVRCPNCDWTGAGNKLHTAKHPVSPDAGDRILVMKWPYDIGGSELGPKRWDVVVFKDPQNGDQNFIKRLLGRPGEVLEIIDGDIYTAPVGDLSAELMAALQQERPRRDPHPKPLPTKLRRELDEKLGIQRKPSVAQESLWLIHYDHDYPPDENFTKGNPSSSFDPPVWRPSGNERESPWDTQSPRITFAPDDDKEYEIRLTGKPIQDHYGYNLPRQSSHNDQANVRDVRVRFVLFPKAAEGTLTLTLTKEDEFRARINADGTVILEKVVPDRARRKETSVKLVAAKIEPLQVDRPVAIEFENLDHRIALRIDDEEVLATTDDQYSPEISKLRTRSNRHLPPAHFAISANTLALEIRHLQVHRDVYYRNTTQTELESPATKVTNDYAHQPGWGTTNYPILLRAEPGDYFCCGDNSPQSKDSRLWWEVCPMLQARNNYNPGTVPADQMIGRAFFVYWPSGYRLFSAPFGFIPNVGRMRIIR